MNNLTEAISRFSPRIEALRGKLTKLDPFRTKKVSAVLLKGKTVEPADLKDLGRALGPHFLAIENICRKEGTLDQFLAELEIIGQSVGKLETQCAGLAWAKDLPTEIKTQLEQAEASVTSLKTELGALKQTFDDAELRTESAEQLVTTAQEQIAQLQDDLSRAEASKKTALQIFEKQLETAVQKATAAEQKFLEA